MFTTETVVREVKNIFGSGVKVRVEYKANFDGYIIEVYSKVGDEVLVTTTTISALEELQAYHPLEMLRDNIEQLYAYVNGELFKEEGKYGNLRISRRKIGREDDTNSG